MHLGSQMAYNFCCDSYHVPNLIYIYYTIVIILGSSMWRVLFLGVVVRWLGFWLLCPLWLYRFSCLLVFWWMGWGWGGVFLSTCSLLFVIAFCSASVASCVISFLWDGCRLLHAVVGGLLSLCGFLFLWGWMAIWDPKFTQPHCKELHGS